MEHESAPQSHGPERSAADALDDVRGFFDVAGPPNSPAAPAFPPPPPSAPTGGTATMTLQAPALPQVAPPVPQPTTAAVHNPFATAMNDHTPSDSSRPGAKKRSSGRGRTFVGTLLVLALLGGAGAAAVMYGSDLMTLATGDDAAGEPQLGKVFPVVPPTAPVIRTASFTVEQPPGNDGPESYQVTTDFETSIAEVVVDGGEQPDLEILTLFNDAVARRSDGVVWYQLPRGAFPVDADLGRARWVRTVDELFPPSIRQWATIERATESVVGNEPTTRLLVSIEPARLAQAPPGQGTVATAAPAAENAAPADGTAAAAPAPATTAPAAPAPTLPPGLSLTTTPDGAITGPVQIEVWIDQAGVVRKLVLPPELGGQTVTVLSYSPDPWQPAFPTAEQVQPITAAGFFELAD